MSDLIEREAAVSIVETIPDDLSWSATSGDYEVIYASIAAIGALSASTRYAELERAARDADEGIASLTNWLHNVTPSPGLEDLVRSCSAADMTPHDAYEHGRILRRFDIAAALRPHIEILARISDAIANLDKEQVDG